MNTAKKTISSLIIFCLSASLFVVLLIYPLFKDIKEKSEELVFQKRVLIERQIKAENLKEIQASYDDCQQTLEKINALLINQETPLDFIKFLEKTAEELNLLIEISPGAFREREAEAGAWPGLNFQISLTGSFLDFSRFLEKLECSSFPGAAGDKGFLIEVQNLNIRTLSEQDVKADLLVKVRAK